MATAVVGLRSVGAETLLTLSSLAGQILKPKKVVIFVQGNILNISEFYFEQVIALLRANFIKVEIRIDKDTGMVNMYRQMISVESDYIWFLNSDVYYMPVCLYQLVKTIKYRRCAAVVGCKVDVSNRHSYKDYSIEPTKEKSNNPFAIYETDFSLERIHLDLGNTLFNKKKLDIDIFPEVEKETTLGEDWIAGQILKENDKKVYMASKALAFHLDTQKKTYNLQKTTKELVSRTLRLLRLSNSVLQEYNSV